MIDFVTASGELRGLRLWRTCRRSAAGSYRILLTPLLGPAVNLVLPNGNTGCPRTDTF